MMENKMSSKAVGRLLVHGTLCVFILAGFASGQANEQESASDRTAQLAEAIGKLRSGEFNGYYAGVIGRARAVEAIPDLERQFALLSDPLDKAKVAQVLLLLGDRKDEYWNYLVQLVMPALESDAPDPAKYDSARKKIPGLSEDFIRWAKGRGESPAAVVEKTVYIWPGYVMLLGASGDPRAIPLLRRAFASANPMIQAAAADGLAQMQDVSSIEMMVARCHEAPPQVAEMIAQSLVYFDDPRVQATVDAYVPSEVVRELREKKKAGEGPLGRR